MDKTTDTNLVRQVYGNLIAQSSSGNDEEYLLAETYIKYDYGYDDVFRRQVEALGREGDVLVGISTSGNSANVVKAFKQAKAQGMKVLALTGAKSSKMSELADVTIKVPAPITARVQECHIMIGHMICEYIDEDY